MDNLVLRLWRSLRGVSQWYVLWFLHDKFMVGVSGIIEDGEGRILLLRHRFWREGSWGLPGGYANKGERLEETVRREVREETGYEVEVRGLIQVVSGYRLRVEASYRGRFVGGVERLDRREVLEARFFKRDDLPATILPTHRKLIQLAFAGEG